MVGPRGREDRAWSATSAGCSSPRRASPCRTSRSCCARPTAWARIAMAAGDFPRLRVHRGVADRRVSARWASRGAVKLGYRKELEAIADPAERPCLLREDGRPVLRGGQGDQTPRPTSRSTRSSTPPRPGAGSSPASHRRQRLPPSAAPARRPLHRPVVAPGHRPISRPADRAAAPATSRGAR